MAPDLNSLPPSPYTSRQPPSSAARRTQDAVASPSIPVSLPSHSPSIIARDPAPTASGGGDNTGVGVGPGPLRHPRPLTAADLHMQLEKEQEAVVNRLTRELSLLRQQSASAASTTSSTSAGLPDSGDHYLSHPMSRANHPTPPREHRSSSSLSTRSTTTAATTGTGITGASGSTVGTIAGIAASTISGIAPARDTNAPTFHPRDPLSRQSSVASRRSENSSPSQSSSLHQGDPFSSLHGHRQTGSISQSQMMNPGSARSSHIPATQRYEEATHHRSELEIVKRENEALRRRIRELERSLISRRDSAPGSSRRESVSTNASVPPQPRPGVDDQEDVIIVGESAGSAGVGGSH